MMREVAWACFGGLPPSTLFQEQLGVSFVLRTARALAPMGLREGMVPLLHSIGLVI